VKVHNRNQTCDFLPKPQVQAHRFQLHISYLLQKCKKGKFPRKGFALLKNDITGSEPAFGIANILQISVT